MLCLQTIFAEESTVRDRVADMLTLSDQLCRTLDVNDGMTLKESVKRVVDRLTSVSGAADEGERSLVKSLDGWNVFQVAC